MPKTAAADIRKGMTFVLVDELRTATADAVPATMAGMIRLCFRTESTGAVTMMVVPVEWKFFAHSRLPHRVNIHPSGNLWQHVCEHCNRWAGSYQIAQDAVDASRTLHAMTNDTIVPIVVGGARITVEDKS